MILKKTNDNGDSYYTDTHGNEVKLQRIAGGKNGRIPNGVYGVYKKPQERGTNKVSNILK